MCGLFKLDDADVVVVEDSFIDQGGQGALDMDEVAQDDAVVQAIVV